MLVGTTSTVSVQLDSWVDFALESDAYSVRAAGSQSFGMIVAVLCCVEFLPSLAVPGLCCYVYVTLFLGPVLCMRCRFLFVLVRGCCWDYSSVSIYHPIL